MLRQQVMAATPPGLPSATVDRTPVLAGIRCFAGQIRACVVG